MHAFFFFKMHFSGVYTLISVFGSKHYFVLPKYSKIKVCNRTKEFIDQLALDVQLQ